MPAMSTEGTSDHLAATERTRVRRLRERGTHDRTLVEAIVDEAYVAHVGFVVDGEPRVLPMTYGRDGDALYLHGAVGNAMLRASAVGEPALASRVGVFHDLMQRMIVGALRGRPIQPGEPPMTDRERLLGDVLSQIWFAVMIGWASGLQTQASIHERMRASVELVLDDPHQGT